MFVRTGEKFLHYYLVRPVEAVIKGQYEERRGDRVTVAAVTDSEASCIVMVYNNRGHMYDEFPKPIIAIEKTHLMFLPNSCPMR